jgi:hypothetical protein
VLDGFPRSYEDCQNVFLKRKDEFDEEGVLVDPPEPLPEDEPIDWEKFFEVNPAIMPQSSIIFNQTDDFLIKRVKNMDEDQVANTHYNLDDMKRRLKSYRSWNESNIAEPSMSEFFKNREVPVFEKDAAETAETAWHTIRIFIEREGKPTNYVFGEESEEAKRRLLVEVD